MTRRTREPGLTATMHGECGICHSIIRPGHRIIERHGTWCHVRCVMDGHE